MPTVHREDGFNVIIYPNDHLPSHVHVIKGGGQVIIKLGSEIEPPSLSQVYGNISNKEVLKALKIVATHQLKLITAWRTIHG
jgi:hypothetical protein